MAWDYYIQIASIFGINAVMALGLNLITGVAGQLSLGHAAFMSIGAYAAALATLKLGLPYVLSLAFGTTIAGMFGLVIGFPTLRLNGDYLAIATLGFGEITRVVLLNTPMVGGALGLSGIPAHTTIWAVTATLVVVLAGVLRLHSSRAGRAWMAIREDETAAEAMGIEVTRWKVLAFMVGASLAGLGGGLYAHMLTYLNPSDFGFSKSIEILNMVVLGGMGSVPGSLIGAVMLSTAPEFLRFMRDYRMMVYGALLVFMMIFRPQGLWGGRRYGLPKRASSLATGGVSLLGESLPAPPYHGSGAIHHQRSIGSSHPPDPNIPILRLDKLTVAFGGLVAVSEVDLEVLPGEIMGLIGPNGAGKTTVFNIIDGLYRPTSGTVTLAGQDATGLRTCRMASLGVSRTFQNIRLFGELTALENVKVGFHIRTRSGLLGALLHPPGTRLEERWAELESLKLLERIGLLHRAYESARSLPYGEQRRLEIARALATDPRLLLLDEPAAGMNPQETSQLMEMIRDIRDGGVTVFLVEHDMHLVTGVCDRVAVLDYGRKIAEGSPGEVTSHPAVITAYLGEEAQPASGI